MKILASTALLCLVCAGCAERPQRGPAKATVTLSAVAIPEFDGNQSYRYLVQQTSFGPRAAGSSGHEQCLQFLASELRRFADTVELQQFPFHNDRFGSASLTNVVAHFASTDSKRVLLLAHWDTRPWADADTDPKKHTSPILGANDGASGVAVLLEIARQLKATRPPLSVSILLVDGEDLGTSGKSDSWCAGSTFFAANFPPKMTFSSAINLDMVGDAELLIKREQRSDQWAPEVADAVFKTAEELGIRQFSNTVGDDVLDDHVPLNRAGIRAIDLIDFDYPNATVNYWHTTEDTDDKCSAESLQAVGTVLLHVLYSKSQLL